MKSILERINSREILVGDGAMGTMLFKRGLKPGECPESVNLKNPKLLEEIAKLYFEAGADIVQTNTFGGSPLKLAQYDLQDKTEIIIQNAVDAVRNVVGEKAYVSGSCGPSAKLLKPYGDTEPEEIYDSFLRQMNAFAKAGVDVICIETMTDLQEATLVIKAAKIASPDIPVMATMTFDETPRGFYTIMGVDIPKAAKGLESAGADIIGSNCGNGIDNMIKIAKEFKIHTDLPVMIQSNAGQPRTDGDTIYYDESPEFFAEKAKELVDIGVSIIGGCCGTTPEHIRAIREVVDVGGVVQNCVLLKSKYSLSLVKFCQLAY